MTIERPLPELLTVWRIRRLGMVAGGGLLAFLVLMVMAHALLDRPWGAAARLAGLVAVAGALLAGAAVERHARAAFARYSWVHRPGEGVVKQVGAWWHEEIWLPVSRLQHLDVVRGPLERRYGLATLALFTAGFHHHSVSLQGLDPERAVALRDALLEEIRSHRNAAP